VAVGDELRLRHVERARIPACAEKIPAGDCLFSTLTTRLLQISSAGPLYLDTANETARAVDARSVNSIADLV
jgi:hypothetical protein